MALLYISLINSKLENIIAYVVDIFINLLYYSYW